MATNFHLPDDHQPGMRVPKGGSSCASCEYLKDAAKMLCGNKDFIAAGWDDKPAGSDKIPAPAPDEYCSDWYGQKKRKSLGARMSNRGGERGTS